MARHPFPLNDLAVGWPTTSGKQSGGPVLQLHGNVVELFSDLACTSPLNARDAADTAAITGVTIDGVTIPRFLGPNDDNVFVVYGRKAGTVGNGFPLYRADGLSSGGGGVTSATVYTLAGRPAATGSGRMIWVSDVAGGQVQQDTAAGVWTPLAPGVSQGNLGMVASTSATANSPGTPTSSTSDVDTGISVTFAAVAAATYRVRLATTYANTVVSKVVNVSICDSSNNRLAWIAPVVPVASTGYPAYLEALVTPGAGSVTYKARISTGSGGTATLIGGATYPTILSVDRVA